jgi:hypothetical protein
MCNQRLRLAYQTPAPAAHPAADAVLATRGEELRVVDAFQGYRGAAGWAVAREVDFFDLVAEVMARVFQRV